jgi:hypothetical protein
MISAISATDNYILQQATFEKHKTTIDWLSATLLWKNELKFFQKILDQFAPRFTSVDDKKTIDHFQSIITYYQGELIDRYKSKLRIHEKHLAEMLEKKNEAETRYYKEHESLMSELEALHKQFNIYKEEFFRFLEPALDY